MSSSSVPPVSLIRFAPTIAVADIDRAVAFYSALLDMTPVFTNGEPPGFVILDAGGVELHLTLVKGHRGSTANVAHLMVRGVDRLYGRCEHLGVKIVKGLRDADFGLRTFVFADPDGNRIDVGE
jgi:catechol 2,3-dioxygenase-like lactoylglutathione lyase family enzyme